MSKIHVTVWNEYRHEKTNEKAREIYPQGIHHTIATQLEQFGLSTATATLDEPEHGLTQEVLEQTDVLIWWGHMAHDEVNDEIVQRVYERVLDGMGIILLHSAHYSKIFKKLMGTSCSLNWREADEKERIWVVQPAHPIVQGIGDYIELEQEEMYGEHFDIPAPDELLMVSWFQGGEVFRSGCVYYRGAGRIFYFRPGHETYPTYHNEKVVKVIANAALWAGAERGKGRKYGNTPPLEKLTAISSSDSND